VEAARQLRLPLKSPTGAPAWGGHALRRGGAQHLAASGVDIWRIQALARHSSDAILRYLDGVHTRNLGNTADAALGRSLAQL
jgi:integrase